MRALARDGGALVHVGVKGSEGHAVAVAAAVSDAAVVLGCGSSSSAAEVIVFDFDKLVSDSELGC